MIKQTATTKIATKTSAIVQPLSAQSKAPKVTSVFAPPAAAITRNISDANLVNAATTIAKTKIGVQMKDRVALAEKPGSGGATGGLVEELMTPRFDQGRADGGHYAHRHVSREQSNTSSDPEDKPGTGWFGFSQNTKENLAVGAAMLGFVASKLGATTPGIGAAALAAAAAILSAKGTPVPSDDFITGKFSGVNLGRTGVGFDPLTGMGPTVNQKTGLFTGDETKSSGVILTREELRNFEVAIGKANGNFQKDPSPMGDSSGSTVIDERSLQRIDLILSGGGLAGPIGNSFHQMAGLQNMQFNAAAEALVV